MGIEYLLSMQPPTQHFHSGHCMFGISFELHDHNLVANVPPERQRVANCQLSVERDLLLGNYDKDFC